MATCGSLRPLFENPITAENPTLIETLSSSWSQIKPVSPVDQSSFTEIFGELHFREKSSLQGNSPTTDGTKSTGRDVNSKQQGSSIDSLLGGYKTVVNQWNGSSLDRLLGVPSTKNSIESLQLCTEGLGIESSDDVEDSRMESGGKWDKGGEEEGKLENHKWKTKYSKNGYSNNFSSLLRRNASGGGAHFPPPISCIGRSGKPCITFKSIKEQGRFVLKEIRIPPTKEFLHALREDGKLRMYLVQPDNGIGAGEHEGNKDGVESWEEEEEGEKEETVLEAVTFDE